MEKNRRGERAERAPRGLGGQWLHSVDTFTPAAVVQDGQRHWASNAGGKEYSSWPFTLASSLRVAIE